MLDILIEFLFELIFEGTIEIRQNRKISKWLRYPLILIIIIFFSLIILLIIYLGLSLLKENILLGFLIIIVAIILLIGSIIKFKNVYLDKYEK